METHSGYTVSRRRDSKRAGIQLLATGKHLPRLSATHAPVPLCDYGCILWCGWVIPPTCPASEHTGATIRFEPSHSYADRPCRLSPSPIPYSTSSFPSSFSFSSFSSFSSLFSSSSPHPPLPLLCLTAFSYSLTHLCTASR